MTISLPAMQAMFAQETGEAPLVCVTVSHASLATPLRLVNDGADLVRSAGTFEAAEFDVSLPGDDPDETPRLGITFSNIDRVAGRTLAAFTTPPLVTIEMVLASTPNVIESGPHVFRLTSWTRSAEVVTAELTVEDVQAEPYPKDSFTPNNSPGLF